MNAKEIAANIEANTDYRAKVESTPEGTHRVHVSRQLSRGRQDMGYVEVNYDGEVEIQLTRNVAGIRRAAGL